MRSLTVIGMDTSKKPTPPTAPSTAPRRRRLIGRFVKNRDGVTAIEFGLVAMPFFALLFAIIETAMIFWSTQVLETAVADASRKIYTGQFQTEHATVTDPVEIAKKFREEVCSRVTALFACNSMIEVDIMRFPNEDYPNEFPSTGLPLPVDEGNFDSTSFGYDASGPNEIVVVRAAMQYPVFLSFMNVSFANLNNGKRLIMASAAFRNEPFSP